MPDSDNTLYLHPDERRLWEALPQGLRDGWTVKIETLSSYESERELEVRRHLIGRKNPQLQKVLRKIGTATDIKTMDDLLRVTGPLPISLLQSILFAVGAATLRNTILDALSHASTAADIDGIALLSQSRHALLQTNVEVVSL